MLSAVLLAQSAALLVTALVNLAAAVLSLKTARTNTRSTAQASSAPTTVVVLAVVVVITPADQHTAPVADRRGRVRP